MSFRQPRGTVLGPRARDQPGTNQGRLRGGRISGSGVTQPPAATPALGPRLRLWAQSLAAAHGTTQPSNSSLDCPTVAAVGRQTQVLDGWAKELTARGTEGYRNPPPGVVGTGPRCPDVALSSAGRAGRSAAAPRSQRPVRPLSGPHLPAAHGTTQPSNRSLDCPTVAAVGQQAQVLDGGARERKERGSSPAPPRVEQPAGLDGWAKGADGARLEPRSTVPCAAAGLDAERGRTEQRPGWTLSRAGPSTGRARRWTGPDRAVAVLNP